MIGDVEAGRGQRQRLLEVGGGEVELADRDVAVAAEAQQPHVGRRLGQAAGVELDGRVELEGGVAGARRGQQPIDVAGRRSQGGVGLGDGAAVVGPGEHRAAEQRGQLRPGFRRRRRLGRGRRQGSPGREDRGGNGTGSSGHPASLPAACRAVQRRGQYSGRALPSCRRRCGSPPPPAPSAAWRRPGRSGRGCRAGDSVRRCRRRQSAPGCDAAARRRPGC